MTGAVNELPTNTSGITRQQQSINQDQALNFYASISVSLGKTASKNLIVAPLAKHLAGGDRNLLGLLNGFNYLGI